VKIHLKMFRMLVAIMVVAGLAVASGCDQGPGQKPVTEKKGETTKAETIVLGTTTSVQDTGLLDVLLPMFKQKNNVEVKPIAVGTGEALAMAKRGEADVVWVHSPKAEEDFVAEGFGLERRQVMYNTFVLLGPAEDPAKVAGSKDVSEAFKKIADAKATFISRGDKSGTHNKELSIWKSAGIEQRDPAWYVESGCGMADSLTMANNKKAYTLCDISTFTVLKPKVQLGILHQGDKVLINNYSVIQTNPAKCPKVKADAAKKFADFLTSKEAQDAIANFGKDKYGESLYTPNASPAK
jgi:tungstate transport system substrate-binding protein